MKKFISAFLLLLSMTVSANAMSYEQARQQALFLTDKMAYELNLNEAQYEAAYEINLDYLMNVMTPDDLYGVYWTRRNLDLSYILFDWQYRTFCSASYFYRPLYWDAGFWHFGIYARYPHRDYFYFGRPAFVNVYHGGHSWHNNGNRSWYHGRDFGHKASSNHFGMRDGFNKGNYGRGQNITFGGARNNNAQRNGTFGSGTRSNSVRNNGTFGSQRNGNRNATTPNNTFSPRNTGNSNGSVGTSDKSTSTSTFGGSRIGNSRNSSIGNSRGLINNSRNSSTSTQSSSRSTFGGSRSSGSTSMSTNRSSVSTNRSSVGSRSSSSSFGGSRGASVSRSSSSGSRSVSGGGSSSGGKFGGRR